MITLDYQSKDPIYLQIKNRIAELVMLGVYPPGTQLPSVRSLAGELGINLKQGYNGDLPSRQAGSIGGYMVKRLIEQAERQMANK